VITGSPLWKVGYVVLEGGWLLFLIVVALKQVKVRRELVAGYVWSCGTG
jgi:hypothetical protein